MREICEVYNPRIFSLYFTQTQTFSFRTVENVILKTEEEDEEEKHAEEEYPAKRLGQKIRHSSLCSQASCTYILSARVLPNLRQLSPLRKSSLLSLYVSVLWQKHADILFLLYDHFTFLNKLCEWLVLMTYGPWL